MPLQTQILYLMWIRVDNMSDNKQKGSLARLSILISEPLTCLCFAGINYDVLDLAYKKHSRSTHDHEIDHCSRKWIAV